MIHFKVKLKDVNSLSFHKDTRNIRCSSKVFLAVILKSKYKVGGKENFVQRLQFRGRNSRPLEHTARWGLCCDSLFGQS